MSLNSISNKLQQFSIFIGNVTRSGVQILIWTMIAAVALAAASVVFRVIWHTLEMILKALGME
ncbi:MAG: hypothetical protein KAU28_03905 [Phycisphaerae bacterium]|nr:hypothetical protein [Phycisphaerae bacterium]